MRYIVKIRVFDNNLINLTNIFNSGGVVYYYAAVKFVTPCLWDHMLPHHFRLTLLSGKGVNQLQYLLLLAKKHITY